MARVSLSMQAPLYSHEIIPDPVGFADLFYLEAFQWGRRRHILQRTGTQVCILLYAWMQRCAQLIKRWRDYKDSANTGVWSISHCETCFIIL